MDPTCALMPFLLRAALVGMGLYPFERTGFEFNVEDCFSCSFLACHGRRSQARRVTSRFGLRVGCSASSRTVGSSRRSTCLRTDIFTRPSGTSPTSGKMKSLTTIVIWSTSRKRASSRLFHRVFLSFCLWSLQQCSAWTCV